MSGPAELQGTRKSIEPGERHFQLAEAVGLTVKTFSIAGLEAIYVDGWGYLTQGDEELKLLANTRSKDC